MKNKASDLNNYLFEQLEKLLDEELTEKELDVEIKRSKAVSSIAANIIQNSNVAIKAMSFFGERVIEGDCPDFLRISSRNEK